MPMALGVGLSMSLGGKVSFLPSSLFAAGIQGVWYDPSDMSTMFQDDAGTTPVTALGQSVGKILDKSGRGNHATQATASSRPIWQQDASGYYYLGFDGSNDSLSTSSIDFSGTDKMTLWTGMRKLSSPFGFVTELSPVVTSNNGSFALFTFTDSKVYFGSNGTTANYQQVATSAESAPLTGVYTCESDIGGPRLSIRKNGALSSSNTTSQGSGNFGNYALFIGRRNNSSEPFNGRIYSFILRGAASSSTEISTTETWVNAKTGAY